MAYFYLCVCTFNLYVYVYVFVLLKYFQEIIIFPPYTKSPIINV